MPKRFLRAALPSLFACGLGMPLLGQAEIYTWVDPTGVVNLSNLAPPDGVRVTRVTHEAAPRVPSASDVAREAARQAELQALADRAKDLEVQALSDRVRQLEREVGNRPHPGVRGDVLSGHAPAARGAIRRRTRTTGVHGLRSHVVRMRARVGSGDLPGGCRRGRAGRASIPPPVPNGQDHFIPRPTPFFALQPLRLSSAPSAGLRGVPHRR